MARYFVGIAWPYANGPFHLGQLAGAFLPARHLRPISTAFGATRSSWSRVPTCMGPRRSSRRRRKGSRRRGRHRTVPCGEHGVLRTARVHLRPVHPHAHADPRGTVQEMFLALLENGYIRRRTEEGPVLPEARSASFPTATCSGRCPHCGLSDGPRRRMRPLRPPVLEPRRSGRPMFRCAVPPRSFRPSEHFYLQLDKLEPRARASTRRPDALAPADAACRRELPRRGAPPDADHAGPRLGRPDPARGVRLEAVLRLVRRRHRLPFRLAGVGHPVGPTRTTGRSSGPRDEDVRAYYFMGKDNSSSTPSSGRRSCSGVGGLQLAYDVPANEWLRIGGGRCRSRGPWTRRCSCRRSFRSTLRT